MKTSGYFLTGMGVGIGAMYFLDPEKGKRRRAMAQDRLVHEWHEAHREVERSIRDTINRARGMALDLRSRMEDEQVEDKVVVARVRSRIGRVIDHPGAIKVECEQGRVIVSGPILEDEMENLLRAISRARGVREIENRLTIHATPEDTPELQGRRSGSAASRQENYAWPAPSRLLIALLGRLLALYAVKQRGAARVVIGAAGAGLAARASLNEELKKVAGFGSERRMVSIQKTIHIHAPVDEVFAFWENYQNFPRIMSHLKEVKDLGNGRSRWVAAGPAGVPVGWDAEVTKFERNQLLEWRSVSGSTIQNEGQVRFDPNSDGSTRVTLRMSYNPPAGLIGHTVASLFGADPKREIDEDLLRLKSLMEHGKTRVHGEIVTKETLANGGSAMPQMG